MKHFIQMECLASLAFRQLCHRDSGPSGNDSCDLILRHTLTNQAQILAPDLFLLCLQFLLKLRQLTVLQFSRFIQIVFLFRILDLAVYRLDFLSERRSTLDFSFSH